MFEIKDIINKVHCGDCLDFMREMPDKCVDLLYTDPPYEQEISGKGSIAEKFNYRRDALLAISKFNPDKFLEIVKPKLKTFHAYIWTSKNILDKYIKFAKHNNYNWDLLVWAKPNPVPAYNNSYLSDQEYCIFIREKGKCYFKNGLGYKQYLKTMIEGVAGNLNIGHPTVKPLWMVERAIQISSDDGHLIFDPFLGSGTTAVACQNLKRNFIGVEISEKYCEIARQRLRQQILL